MAVRSGESVIGGEWGTSPRAAIETAHAKLNVRLLIRDALLVFISLCIPGVFGVRSGALALALPAATLGILVSRRASVPRIVRVLQFFMSYCAVWYSFGILRNMSDSVAWAEQTQLFVWRAERWLFGGELLNARLQRWLYEPGDIQLWDRGLMPVYASFFVASLVVGAVVAWRDWERAWRYFVAKSFVLVIGLAIIAALPTTPPWMTPDSALTADATSPARVYRVTTIVVGQGDDYVFAQDGNPIAAMPSIHMATTFLILMLLWSRGRIWRSLGLAYSLAMAFLLVYYGEHYVLDELAGVLLAIGGWLLAGRWVEQWSPALRGRFTRTVERRPRPAASPAAPST